jgi:site-specific recombinase XerD
MTGADIVGTEAVVIEYVPAARRRAETIIGAFLATYSNEFTRRGRRFALKHFLAYLDELGVEDPIHDVRRGHIDTWARSLEAAGQRPGTVSAKLSSVAAFYHYLVAEEILVRDPTIAVKRPKVSKESTREFLTPRELADFMTEAETEGGYPYLLACLLSYNALRISEACNANVEHLGRDKHHTTLFVTRKGGLEEIIALPGPTLTALRGSVGDRDAGPLLLNRIGRRMDREAASKIVRRLAIKARIAKNVTPHSLRHSSITALLMGGATVDDAAAFAGHIDPRTTKVYDRRIRKLDAHGAYSVVSTIAHYQR